MGYSLDYHDQVRFGMVDPPTPEEEAEHWAESVGKRDGANFGVSEEGRAALSGEPWERKAYLYGYQESFLWRKRYDDEITEEEWHYYDPFRPEAWNYGLEMMRRPEYAVWRQPCTCRAYGPDCDSCQAGEQEAIARAERGGV